MATSEAEPNRVPTLDVIGSSTYLFESYGWSSFEHKGPYNYYADNPNIQGVDVYVAPLYAVQVGFMRAQTMMLDGAGNNGNIWGSTAVSLNASYSSTTQSTAVYPTAWNPHYQSYSLRYAAPYTKTFKPTLSHNSLRCS